MTDHMAAVVSIISRHSLRIEAYHRTNLISKLALYNFNWNSHLKQLYISNKTDYFNYKGGCGIRVLRHLKEVLA